jgi:hypothetical protein
LATTRSDCCHINSHRQAIIHAIHAERTPATGTNDINTIIAAG